MSVSAQTTMKHYLAWDTVNNCGKTGDAAHHTLRVTIDGSEVTPAGTPTEVDATNMPGVYQISLDGSSENAGTSAVLGGKSATSGIVIVPTHWENLDATIGSRANGYDYTATRAAYLDVLATLHGRTNNHDLALLLGVPDTAGHNVLTDTLQAGAAMTLTSTYDAAKTAAAPGAKMDLIDAPNLTGVGVIATAATADILATPANKLATDGSGHVTTTNPGGGGATADEIADKILATPANLIATDADGKVTTSNPGSAPDAGTVASAVWDAVSRTLTSGTPPTTVEILDEIMGAALGFAGTVDKTVRDALQAAYVQARGKWVDNGEALTATEYAPDGTTPYVVFDIDNAQAPTQRTPRT
jgi:hypothetical protein